MKNELNSESSVIDLLTWKPFYADVESGKKSFDVRRRTEKLLNVDVGDILRFIETDRYTNVFTGRFCYKQIVYRVDDEEFDFMNDIVCYGLKPVKDLSDEEKKQLNLMAWHNPRKGDKWKLGNIERLEILDVYFDEDVRPVAVKMRKGTIKRTKSVGTKTAPTVPYMKWFNGIDGEFYTIEEWHDKTCYSDHKTPVGNVSVYEH